VLVRVGVTHYPLPVLFNAFTDAGLTFDRLAEGGPHPDCPGHQDTQARQLS
jgi:hypothetical protein